MFDYFPIEVIVSVGFFLCFRLPQSISKPLFRRRKDDGTPSINIPMVVKNIRHRRQVGIFSSINIQQFAIKHKYPNNYEKRITILYRVTRVSNRVYLQTTKFLDT